LYRVVEVSIVSGKFPTEWKKAKVACIHKKGSKKNCSNYRPISLLSIPSKTVEHLISSQLNNHLTNFNLQNDHQWGFRPQRSTEDLLLYMTEKWRKAIDNGLIVGVLFIDFKKAFDSISHTVLLKKLNACGISGNFLQFTIVNGTQSNEASIDYGVPQGSILGPSCFSINVNDMPENVDCALDLFADDTTAYEVDNSVDKVLNKLKKDILCLHKYATKNSLTIHPDKCEILILSKAKFTGPLPIVEMDGNCIKVVQTSKCLGITVLYGILIWGNCSPTYMSHIEKIHIRAARFIHCISKKIPDIEILQKVSWKPILHYYKRSLANKVYAIYNNLTSPLLKDFIKKSN